MCRTLIILRKPDHLNVVLLKQVQIGQRELAGWAVCLKEHQNGFSARHKPWDGNRVLSLRHSFNDRRALSKGQGDAPNCRLVYPTVMEKKPPPEDSKNRFAEVIRKSQERRAELNNQTRRKQIEDTE